MTEQEHKHLMIRVKTLENAVDYLLKKLARNEGIPQITVDGVASYLPGFYKKKK